MIPPISIWREAAWPQLELYCFSPPGDVASCFGATTGARESAASPISLNFGGAAWKSLSACCPSHRVSALQTLSFSAVCACCCHVAHAVHRHVSSKTHLRIIQALHSGHEQVPQVRKRLPHLRISETNTPPAPPHRAGPRAHEQPVSVHLCSLLRHASRLRARATHTAKDRTSLLSGGRGVYSASRRTIWG